MGNIVLPIDAKHVSDGYHTFGELYQHRHFLVCALMVSNSQVAWKSRLHEDGTMFDDMFIAGIDLPSGTITYHLDNDMWDFIPYVKELTHAPKWDEHTSNDVLERLGQFCVKDPKESQ